MAAEPVFQPPEKNLILLTPTTGIDLLLTLEIYGLIRSRGTLFRQQAIISDDTVYNTALVEYIACVSIVLRLYIVSISP